MRIPFPGPAQVARVVFALAVFHCICTFAASPGTTQRSFDSPEAAADALAGAWHGESPDDLVRIFGPGGAKLVVTGDATADRETRTRLAAEFDVQHRVERKGNDKAFLILGNDEFPYPIPLVRVAKRWRFDTAAGEQEILDRRIGRDELHAIEVCRAYVESQREFAAKDALGNGLHEFARRIASSPGKHDGLYWQAHSGERESPFGPLIADAAAEGYGTASSEMLSPYQGYFFRILQRQGANAPGGTLEYVANGHMTRGFALVAYPAKYADSGIMTFLVNQDGIVFEKNLGADTARIARQILSFNPDKSWRATNASVSPTILRAND